MFEQSRGRPAPVANRHETVKLVLRPVPPVVTITEEHNPAQLEAEPFTEPEHHLTPQI